MAFLDVIYNICRKYVPGHFFIYFFNVLPIELVVNMEVFSKKIKNHQVVMSKQGISTPFFKLINLLLLLAYYFKEEVEMEIINN
jgi:hypothetical protein